MKIKHNNFGFTVIEALILLVAVGLIVFAGLKVYDRMNGEDAFVPTGETTKLAVAHNELGLNLLRDLTNDNNSNVLISPTSISLALSMTYNGAQGQTKTDMQKALSLQGFDVDSLNEASNSLMDSLKKPDDKVELSIANSLWIRKGTNLNKDTISKVADSYQAKVAELDFGGTKAPSTINKWVSDNTKDKITKIVDGQIPDDMLMYLINAVYFKGSWTKEFDKDNTYDSIFYAANGEVKSPFMNFSDDAISHLKTDKFEAAKLPYGENKRLAMYLFKPVDLNEFINSLTSEQWTKHVKQFADKKGHVSLPKFKLEYSQTLNDSLKTLGMGDVFNDGADFGLFGDSLAISEVRHKTFIDVSETGTEAAAVTSVGVKTTSVSAPDDRFSLILDKPFFYAIADSKTGELLFTGVLNSPKAN